MNRASGAFEAITEDLIFAPGELKIGGADKVLEKQNPPNLAKEINLQRSLVVSNGITPVPPQKTIPRHIIVKLVKIKKNLKIRNDTFLMLVKQFK